MVQTMLTKCLGPLSEWDAMMELPAKCGFNMIHFSPLQHLGHSGSCYSIYDQLLLSKAIFPVRIARTGCTQRMSAADVLRRARRS